MKRIFITSVLISSCFLSAAFAAKDVTTNPDQFYLTEAQAPNSLELLPPPPAFNSVDFLRDRALYDWGKALRTTERGKQAYNDADSSEDNVAKEFSPSFGFEISAQNAPQVYKLISTMKEDAGDLATRSAKQHYNRVRPFSFFKEPTCRPEDEQTLSSNGSYPSGHTTIGWAIALVLAEINPERQNQILKRGFEIGESRVICGYHWQSDIDAARVMASAVVARLHADPEFIDQLQKAKDELQMLKQKKS